MELSTLPTKEESAISCYFVRNEKLRAVYSS